MSKANKKYKALVLLSGGLDSMLAAKLLMEQGIEVSGVCFESGFYNSKNAVKAAKALGVELKIIDISQEMVELVKNPPNGYGKHLNPCLDCHGLMVKMAGEFMDSVLCDFIATGEVLGQRPFSQNRSALARVEKLAGREILRPLSAQLLPKTEYEKSGLVIRGRLLDISGRARERQMELAKKYGLTEYAAPAGGCLLTDPEFSERLGKMIEYWPKCGSADIELLKHGRVFWIKLAAGETGGKKNLIVVGRHRQDNDILEKLAGRDDFVVELKEVSGPVAIVRVNCQLPMAKQISNFSPAPMTQRVKKFQIQKIIEIYIPEKLKMGELKLGESKSMEEIVNLAALLTGYYATKARGKKVKVEVKTTINN